MVCTECNHNPCRCKGVKVEGITLYTEKALHVGYPWMLGRIIKVDFYKSFYSVTVRYTQKDIADKVYKVIKTDEIGAIRH